VKFLFAVPSVAISFVRRSPPLLIGKLFLFSRCTLLALVMLLMSCGRRSAPKITSINDEPTPPSEGPRQTAFLGVAEKVRPAVVVLATFDEHGGLVANEHAFFISASGDLLAEQSAMNNAASAVAKSVEGKAYDIFGTYVRSTAPNFIVLKTNAHNVPHLDAGAAATVFDGAHAAVVLGSNSQPSLLEGRISGRKVDVTGEWLTFAPPLPKTAVGAPAIDEKGALIGVVAQHGDKGAPMIFHAGPGTSTVAIAPEPVHTPETWSEETRAESTPWVQLERSTPPPMEKNPQRVAEVDLNKLQAERNTPPPTPSGFFIRMNPNWHIHARDRPQPPGAERIGKLVYTPAPQYSTRPTQGSKVAGTGSYRLTFNSEGKVTDVQVTRSAGSNTLDDAAVATLRNWRAEPGGNWRVTVPINFGRR
jgi:protein TonB